MIVKTIHMRSPAISTTVGSLAIQTRKAARLQKYMIRNWDSVSRVPLALRAWKIQVSMYTGVARFILGTCVDEITAKE